MHGCTANAHARNMLPFSEAHLYYNNLGASIKVVIMRLGARVVTRLRGSARAPPTLLHHVLVERDSLDPGEISS